MFVNKISIPNVGFKGYQHVKNDVGETVMRFNYPYDSDKETCEIQIFRATPTDKYNHKIDSTPVATVQLKPEGVDVNLQELTNLDKDAPFAYKVVRKDKSTGKVIWEGADTGMKVKPENGEYVNRVKVHGDLLEDSISNYTHTLVSRKGTTPMVQGAGYLVSPDSLMPGAMYRGFAEENTGEIYYDKDYQKKMEGVIKNFSNVYGGSAAGVQKAMPYFKENGYRILYGTPFANGSQAWALGYWNENNMQPSPNVGNTENLASFFRDLYKNDMKFVFDGTFTSEGWGGVTLQYALRWAELKNQFYYHYRMNGIKDAAIGHGAMPKNAENAGLRFVNAPYNFEKQADGTYKEVPNPNFNSKKETLSQIYDKLQASERQVKDYDKEITYYENIRQGNELDINSHDDTLINYVVPIRDFKEVRKNVAAVNDLIKKYGKDIDLNSPEGIELVMNLSNVKLTRKTEGGIVTWDANTDMFKKNYHLSGYDEKQLQAIVSRSERDYERQMMERGAREVQDMALQVGKYWTGKVRNIQTLYTAQTIGSAKSVEALKKLVNDGKLPGGAELNNDQLTNILNGHYLLAPKGVLTKDDVTVKSLMSLPLDSLEFGKNTVGVLATSYFSNRATTEETIGVSRFDLMKQNNPHLVEPYAKNYKRVNSLFNNEIKDFADKIIRQVNATSNEKLLDKNGDYTEYGEYVMELVGQDITKYAFLKALGGDSFKTKILNTGEMTYDYQTLSEGTTLKALGINANSPEDEAQKLASKIENGMKKLSTSDVSYVADSISKRIAGTDTASFRLAEALVEKSALGLDWRLDAAKDVMDMDAIRNEDNTFDDNWDNVIKFLAKFVQAVKTENPNTYTVAELTDIEDLMKDTYGAGVYPYANKTNLGQKFNGEPDAFAKFFAQTGITSEAGYSYFFTDLLTIFAPSFDEGNGTSENHDRFKARFDLLMECRSVDYLRNLYTFMGNHDKPRMIHGLAVDMTLFHANLLNDWNNFSQGHKAREAAIKVLSGAKTNAEIPIELRLNVDNNNYFLTESARAIAVSKLLMDVINEDKSIPEDDRKRLIDALVDLTNGNYLGKGVTENMQKIKIKELSSLEAAFNEVLKLSGKTLSKADIDAVVKKANEKDLSNYLVQGDLDWSELDAKIKERNESNAKDIVGAQGNYAKYSLYTIQLAKLLKDSYKEVKPNDSLDAGFKAFAEKYDNNMVKSNTDEFKKIEDPVNAMRKNAYAARDLRRSLEMAAKQAEFKSGKSIANKQSVIDRLYQTATEPAVKKAEMIMEFLKGLPGIPTMYAGDEMGMTGYEEKAKNVYLQNRNALPWTETEGESDIAKYRKSVMAAMNGALKDRSNPELAPLNNGTPYKMDVQAHNLTRDELSARINELNKQISEEKDAKKKEALVEERRMLSKDFAKIAYMMQSANGDMTVTLFNAGDVDFDNRAKQDLKPSEIDMLILGAGVALPVGTVFANAMSKDKTEYVVKEINGKKGIVRKDGKKIIMDSMTSKNGVMILKRIKNIIFRGAPKKVYYNKQYNFASNPYKQIEQSAEGEKLSIIAG